MNRRLACLTAFASLIVLAGCGVSGGGGGGGNLGPFPGETPQPLDVQPSFDSAPVQSNVTLSAGQSNLYRVDISDSVAAANDVVYFDAVPKEASKVTGHLQVTTYTVSDNQADPLFVSQTNEWFGRPNDTGLLSMSGDSGLTPAAVASETPSCGGPCVVVPTPDAAGTAYMRVEALQGTVEFDLYVVATDFSDLSEPNDVPGNAEMVTGAVASGTIELVGDSDWYETQGSVSRVDFNGNDDVNLLANVCTFDGVCRTLTNTGSRILSPAQAVRVEVYSDEQQERAGAAGKALYSVEFTY